MKNIIVILALVIGALFLSPSSAQAAPVRSAGLHHTTGRVVIVHRHRGFRHRTVVIVHRHRVFHHRRVIIIHPRHRVIHRHRTVVVVRHR